MNSQHAALITKLEALTEPCRETDALIYCAMNCLTFVKYEAWNGDDGRLHYEQPGIAVPLSSETFPRVTESIDAAMTLVPKGMAGHVDFGQDVLFREYQTSEILYGKSKCFGVGASSAIALCIAAIKALALPQSNGGEHD